MKLLLKSKLSGQAIYKRYKTMLLTGWKYKQNVFLVSNLYGRKEVIKEKRVKGGRIQEYKKPLIEIYNHYMHGVNLSNQLINYILQIKT